MSQRAAADAWETIEADVWSIYRRIWEEPELGMMEYSAETRLSAWLADHDFTVERGVCGLPTAFRAVWSSGDGPRLGFLAEYDALPGQGNRLEPLKAPDGKRAGHACGHNLIAGNGAGSAIAVRHAMEECGIKGTVVCLGTPGEEILWGKIAMLRHGAFDNIDMLFANHADYQNGAISRACLSCVSFELVFEGRASHGGALRSGNALDGAELFVQSMERLRAHQFGDVVIGHVLRFAGFMPSITPDEARLWVTVRHESFERARDVACQLVPLARDCARHTHTGVVDMLISASRGYLANHTLGEVLHRHMQEIGPPAWNEADTTYMRSLAEACSPEADFVWDREIGLHKAGCDPYGQDDGEASWSIPLARANWSCPRGVLLHNWAMTSAAGHDSQFKGASFAGKAITMAAIEILAEPGIIDAARQELARRTEGYVIGEPRCGGFEVMTTSPESFWDGSWSGCDRVES